MKFENPKMNRYRGPVANKAGLEILEDIRREASILGLALPEKIKCKNNKNIYGDVVYFVESNELIKIGYTSCLLDRLYNLKYICPCELKLVAVIPVIADGLLVEKYLHDGFDDYRVRGEWFRKSDELMVLLDIFSELSCHPAKPVEAAPKSEMQNESRNAEAEAGSDIMTIDEAADYLQIHMVTLRRMLKTGEIPARMVRNKWRFSRRQLQEWIEKKNGKGEDHGTQER